MSEKININAADVETLTTISGIGPALAQRIIEYREMVHPFEEVIELAAVPGVSEKMVRGFADKVTVSTVAAAETAASSDDDDVEEMPLLAAPEPVERLEAPEQPEALLAAKLPEVEEIIMDEPASDVGEIDSHDASDETISMEEETVEPEPVAEAEEGVQTAVPEPTPVITAEPTEPQTAVSIQPPVNWEAKARRRGCFTTLLAATFGAILGAVLTLAVLAALNNGSLNYAAPNAQIRQQLDREIISRTNELDSLATRVSVVATEEAEANQALQTDFEAANEDIANNEEIISYLATRSGDLELRLQDVAGAAESFNHFLDGLSALLTELDESTATPTPTSDDVTSTPTPTPTPTNLTTPLPTATTAVQPTRTPQPTATPFTFPTNTPAPQP